MNMYNLIANIVNTTYMYYGDLHYILVDDALSGEWLLLVKPLLL